MPVDLVQEEHDDDAAPDEEPAAVALDRAWVPQPRGLDAGIAKTCPDPSNLDKHKNRDFRRRAGIYAKLCIKRGKEAATEGAFMLLNQFQRSTDKRKIRAKPKSIH